MLPQYASSFRKKLLCSADFRITGMVPRSASRKPMSVALSSFSCKLQYKYAVGNDATLLVTSNVYSPLKRLEIGRIRKVNILDVERPNIRTVAAGDFDGNHEIGDQQSVIEKYPTNAIFFAPMQLMKGRSKFTLQDRRSFVSDPVGHAPRAALIIVDLTPWPFDEAVGIAIANALKPAGGCPESKLRRGRNAKTDDREPNGQFLGHAR